MPFVEEHAKSRPLILCLCGYQGHGKTEVARYLERAHGFHRASFAEPIRAMLRAAGVPGEAFSRERKDLPCAELGGGTPRDAMESLGAWGRGVSPEFWASAWARSLTAAGDPPQVVVDDARFDLETAYALAEASRRGADFVIAVVVRPGCDIGTEHPSNRIPALNEPAVVVWNTSGVAALGRQVTEMMAARGYV